MDSDNMQVIGGRDGEEGDGGEEGWMGRREGCGGGRGWGGGRLATLFSMHLQ